MYPPCSTPMEAAAAARPAGLLVPPRPGSSRARARTWGHGSGAGYPAAPSAAPRRLLAASLRVRESLPAQPPREEEAVAVEAQVDEDADDPAGILPSPDGPALADTVRVKFVLEKECAFGQHFLVVGDDPALGLWDPARATALEWSDGHVWTAKTDLPANKLIEFKFLLRDASGQVRWQDGGNRTLQTTDTPHTLVVHEDWDHAEKQRVAEEEELSVAAEEGVTFSGDLAGSTTAGAMLAAADLLQPGEQDLESSAAAVAGASSLHEEVKAEANEEDQPQLALEEDRKVVNELYGAAEPAPQSGYPSGYDDDGTPNEDGAAARQDDAQTANRSTSIFENDLAWARRALQHLLRFLGFQVGTSTSSE